MFRLLLSAVLAAAVQGYSGDIGRSVDGYTYFHRTGASMEDHNKAVLACVYDSEPSLGLVKTGTPFTQGFITQILNRMMQDHINVIQFYANLENCMVASGWQVIRLNDDEGMKLTALGQVKLAEALSRLVGAEDITGEMARQYTPLKRLKILASGLNVQRRASLSLRAQPEALVVAALNLAPATQAPLQVLRPSTAQAANFPPGSTLVVIAVATVAPSQSSWDFINFEKDRAYFRVASPTKFLWKPGSKLEQTYVFAVPPGRWRLAGTSIVGTCLGAPSFTVEPGKVIFAGYFNAGAADPATPDMSLDTVKPNLPPEIAASIEPAHYEYSSPYSCRDLLYPYIYSHQIVDGARSVP